MLEFFSQIARRVPSTEFYFALPFWLYFVAILVALRSARPGTKTRDLLLLGANAFMLMALPRFNEVALLLYCVLAVVTFGLGHGLNRGVLAQNPRGRIALATIGILSVLFVLAVFKYHFLQGLVIWDKSMLGNSAGDFVFLICISYASFKAMHIIVESYKQTLKNLRFLNVLNYLLFFPSFVSGPINRYNEFHEDSVRAKTSALRDDILPGLERIIHGLFKKFVITVLLLPYSLLHIKTPLPQLDSWQILIGLYTFALYFYFDFSGYTDLAIGSARLLGYTLPENFNQPFLKKNIQQLWANWHMSLTGWLTDYVYWPLVRKMRNSDTLRQHPLVISNVAIIITFFLCGAWHGETLNFILWGIYHGIGIAIVNGYQKWKRKVRNPLVIKYFGSRLSYGVGVFLTFNFFALGLLFFLDAREVATVFGRLLTCLSF
jgi:alginate O-acetyltransferase complex protein AlgI